MAVIKLFEEAQRRKLARRAKKAAEKEEREKKEKTAIGRDSESRLRIAVSAVVWAINNIPHLELNAEMDFSGEYDPVTKLGDRRDHDGEDASIFVRSRDCKWWAIYDGKSSKERADKFNSNIKYIRDQRQANLKKAIVTFKDRPMPEILEEIFDDLIVCGIDKVKQERALILEKALTAA